MLIKWLERVGFPPLAIVRRRCPKAGHRSLYEQMWNCETLPSPALIFGAEDAQKPPATQEQESKIASRIAYFAGEDE